MNIYNTGLFADRSKPIYKLFKIVYSITYSHELINSTKRKLEASTVLESNYLETYKRKLSDLDKAFPNRGDSLIESLNVLIHITRDDKNDAEEIKSRNRRKNRFYKNDSLWFYWIKLFLENYIENEKVKGNLEYINYNYDNLNYNELNKRINDNAVDFLINIDKLVPLSNFKELIECLIWFQEYKITSDLYENELTKKKISVLPPKKLEFDKSLETAHQEKLKPWIYPDYIKEFISIEVQLLHRGCLSEQYKWVLDRKRNFTKINLVKFITLIQHYNYLKTKVQRKEKEDYHYRQFFSMLYGFKKSGLNQTYKNNKEKFIIEHVKTDFHWLNTPTLK